MFSAKEMLLRTWDKIARIISVYGTTFILEQGLPLSVTHIYWQQSKSMDLSIHYPWQTAIQEHGLIFCTACKLRG